MSTATSHHNDFKTILRLDHTTSMIGVTIFIVIQSMLKVWSHENMYISINTTNNNQYIIKFNTNTTLLRKVRLTVTLKHESEHSMVS